MNIAIILAAGTGQRFNKELPKQFTLFEGKPLFLHSLEKFLLHEQITKTYLVINQEYEADYLSHIKSYNVEIIYGGKRRQDSALNALSKITSQNPTKVLIHDAARPFISIAHISEILNSIQNPKTAITPGIQSSDTLRQIAKDNSKTLPRDLIYAMQTPQGFFFSDIYHLHNKHNKQDVTDDAQLFELEEGYKVEIIDGDKNNRKITTKSDLQKAESPNLRIGLGSDIHKFSDTEEDSIIKIAGVSVLHNKSIIAHSDGDVVLHAIVDALLGTCGMGDIGEFFPDTDPKFKNHNSEFFVKTALQEAQKHQINIINLDIIIICEKPKLKPYKDEMRQNLSRILNLAPGRINIKGKTNEKLDAIGEKKAIAAFANILVSIS